jgi:hypothetical protein
MVNLNLILLEGTVSGKPGVVKEGGVERCSFVVSSLGYVRAGKGVASRETRVWVMVRDPGLVKSAIQHAYDGRGMRAVGRLTSDEDGDLYIEAEHIEYRPESKTADKRHKTHG